MPARARQPVSLRRTAGCGVRPGGAATTWFPVAVLAAVLAGNLVFAGPVAAQPRSGCPAADRVDLAIETLDSDVKYVFNRSVYELSDMPGRSHVPPGLTHAPVLGLSTVRLGIDSEMAAIFSLGANATVCGRLSMLQVRVGYQERTVLVAKELPKGSCIHNEVLTHERKHVAVDDAMLKTFTSLVRPRIEALIARIGPVVARSQSHAMNVLRGQVDRELDALSREMNRERDRRQAEVDTLEEYQRVTDSCNREVRKYLKGDKARM